MPNYSAQFSPCSLLTASPRKGEKIDCKMQSNYSWLSRSVRELTLHNQMSIKPIPDGFHAITPYLFTQGASRLIEFISAAFNGEVTFRETRPDGAIMHATMRIGDSMLMVADATPQFGPTPPQSICTCAIATPSIIPRSTQAEFRYFPS